MEKADTGELRHIAEDRPTTVGEIEVPLRDVKHLTYGGIAGE